MSKRTEYKKFIVCPVFHVQALPVTVFAELDIVVVIPALDIVDNLALNLDTGKEIPDLLKYTVIFITKMRSS